MACVESPAAAIHAMKLQCSIYPLPKVNVSHRGHLPKTLPPPTGFTPLRNPVGNALLDILGAADQRHPRRLVERFQRSDNSQQLEPLTPQIRFDVGDLHFG